jgi:hypothetical protein
MTVETESQHFRGVVCLHCQAPIPVPAIVGGDASSSDREISSQDNSSVFALRCPSCHKEKPYQSREIVYFEGTPETILPQVRPASSRSFRQFGISKAAKA